MKTARTVQMHCKLNQFGVTCLRVLELAWSVRRALHHMPPPRVPSCLLPYLLINHRQSTSDTPIPRFVAGDVAAIQYNVFFVRLVAWISSYSSRQSLLRCPQKQHSICTSPPPQFPDPRFPQECLSSWFTRNMQLPSLLQDLVECYSWIHCGRSLSGTRTVKSSWENEFRNLTLSIHLVQFALSRPISFLNRVLCRWTRREDIQSLNSAQ